MNSKEARREFIIQYKLERGCAMCHYPTARDLEAWGPEAVARSLQLDHVDPSLKFRNSKGEPVKPAQLVRRYGWDVLFAELENCQVLCANHHSLKTAEAQMAGEVG